MEGLVFYLNGARGLASLRAVLQAGHGVRAVVMPANKPVDGVAALCSGAGAELWSVEDINADGFVARLRSIDASLGVICGYSTIFKKAVADAPRLGTINLHGGRLPQYRGGSPLNWQIINGEAQLGLSVIRIDEGIDTGPVLASGEFALGLDQTIADAHARANALFPELLLSALARIEQGAPDGPAQQEADACYWHQRSESDGRIDWSMMSARQVNDLVRSLSPLYPAAYSYDGEIKLRIERTAVPREVVRGTPGRVCWVSRRGPYVVCRDRAVLVLSAKADDAGEWSGLRHGRLLT